ncbi:hypothetical protein SUDANB120_06330 (plasmid) [Streptomyces sp. enrichment culture]|uniref:hypothetical protein n=1 Tax=Streptomyces sp. enrichment culture TaxID=1795815 RepID=UPI003F549CEC
MCTTYLLRISGAAGAAPETAAVRLIATLPADWGAILLHCTRNTATLALVPPGALPAAAVGDAVDAALDTPALRGWTRKDLAAGVPPP